MKRAGREGVKGRGRKGVEECGRRKGKKEEAGSRRKKVGKRLKWLRGSKE